MKISQINLMPITTINYADKSNQQNLAKLAANKLSSTNIEKFNAINETNKISQLKERISNKKYQIDAEQIASKIIAELI